MKKTFTKILTALALLVFMTTSLAGWADNVTLTSQQIKAGTGSTSYGSCSATDGDGNTWYAYAIKTQHSNATSDYHCWQIKKYASNTAYYVQVPELGTKITSITMTVSHSSKPMDGGGNTATLYFSNSNSTSTTGTGVASGTGDGSVTINCSDLNLNTGFITASGAVRIWNVEVTYTTGGSDTYTVTYNKNGDDVTGSVPTDENTYNATNNTVTVKGNTGNLAKPGNDWSGWCLNDGGTGTVYGPDYTTTYTISSSTTFYAKWTPHTHNVTMPVADTYGSYSASATSNVPYGTAVTLTYTPATGFTDYVPTWSVNGTTISGNTFSMPDENVTVTVTLAQVKVDELTKTFIGVGGSYTNWSDKTGASGAVYAGRSLGSSTNPAYIQLNYSTDNSAGAYHSGIITTGSGGTIKKVVVTWATKGTNTANRYLTVYGKNTAYSSKDDLYDANARGTSLGTITYYATNPETTLFIDGNYKYMGLLASGAMTFDKIEIYWEPSNDPSISANDVEIAYTATSGNITYTINNEPSPAGTLTAAIVSGGTIADLALSTIANNTVPFTCSANTAAAERTATVTLTYTYGDNQTATKDVTITQAGNPDAVHLISDINATGTNYTIRGTVVALSNYACVIGDGTGYVYFYNGYAAPTYTGGSTKVNVGDKVKVSGNMTSYGHIYQFSTSGSNTATIEAATSSNYDETPAVTIITEIPTSTYSTDLHLSDYFQFEGTLTKAANATNYYVGVGEGQIQISYPSSAQQTAMNALLNKTVRVKGYFAGINSSSLFSIIMESIEEVVSTEPYITIESNEFELTANEEEGYLEIEYGNFNPISFDIMYCDANGVELSEDPDWLALSIEAPAGETGDFVYYNASANDGVARDAYFMVYASLGENQGAVYSNLVHVTQAGVNIATLPFTWDGSGTPEGVVTKTNVGSYNTSLKAKFNNNDGEGIIVLRTNSAPGAIAFNIKGNPSSGTASTGTFSVAISADNIHYTTLATYTIITNVEQTKSFTNISSDTRYIKWSYSKSNNDGNVALGNIIVTKAMGETIAANANVTWTEGSFTPADNHTYIVNSGTTLTLSGDFHDFFDKPYYLIVKDGGKLITDYTIKATMQKDITTWTTGTTPGGWYFIASPIQGTIDPSTVGLITDNLGSTATTANATYDLYKYDATNTSTPWINYRAHTDNFVLANGAGYLYANAAGQTFEFSGEINPYSTTDNKVTLANTGWNLIGNPFSCAVTVDKAFSELNNGTAVSNQSAGSTIYPCRGIAVYGNAGDEVTFAKPVVNTPGPSNLNIVLAQQIVTRSSSNEAIIDNAVISFNESEGLPKFTLFEGNAKLYIPQGTEEYAIVSAEAQGEMPVNFVATVDGEYTLTVNAEDVEMNYLHLIDNLTGADIDLRANPSYTFNGSTMDYPSRFRLMFSANNANNENGNDNFAFISNGQIVLTEQGNAMVYDITGRLISSHNNASHITTEGMAAGVYVLQLVNGSDVKTQKIVVR